MKNLLTALVLLIIIVSCDKKDHGDTNLHITGNVKGLNQGKLYIQRAGDTSMMAIDTITISGNSEFESHLKLDSPEMLFLFLDRGQTNSVDNNLPFFAEPGNITIETTIDEFFGRAKITGSENHKRYEEFLKIKSRFTGQNLDLVKKNIEATKNSNVAQLDSITEAMRRLESKRYLHTANFALNNSKYEVAPYLALVEIPNINMKYLDTIHKSMSPKVAKSYYGKMLTKFVEERKQEEAGLAKQ